MLKRLFVLFICALSISSYAQTAYKLHDQVKVKWSGSWWDAEIVQVNGDQYKIHYNNYGSNWDEWVKTDRMQPRANAGATTTKESTTGRQNTPATSGNFSAGDKVEAWSAGVWYPASIVSTGSGKYAGYYYVHFTAFGDASNQWLNAASVRKLSAKTNTAAVVPRDGKYKILSYGNPANPIYLGYFTLKAGSYSYYNAANQLLGSGTYSYDKTSKTVKWNSGPFKTSEWGGAFEVSGEGKTHTIRLKGVTIATNSTDA